MIDPIELPENDTLVQKYKNALSVEVDIQMCDDLIQLLEARRIEYEKKTSIKEFNSEKLILQLLF